MRVLKMLGFIALYMGIWLVTQVIAAVIITIPMMLSMIIQGKEPSFENIMVSGVSWILILSSIIATLLFWVIYLIREKNFYKELKVRALPKQPLWMSLLAGLGISLALNGVMNIVDISEYFPEASQELAEMFSGSDLLPLLLAVGIVVPIFEELMFRGIIFNEMKRAIPLWLAVMLSGLIFGLAHMNIVQIIYTVPMGMLLAVLYWRTGSLWTPILVHMAWNITSVLTSVITVGPSSFALIAMVLLGLGLVIFATRELWAYNPPEPPESVFHDPPEPFVHYPAPPPPPPSRDLVL